MINFHKVSKHTHDQVLFEDVSFTLNPGQLTFLVGLSGSGKTTLLKMIYGQIEPDSGEIVIGNHQVSNFAEHQWDMLRRRIGVISQSPVLLDDESVYDNLRLALEIIQWPEETIDQRINLALERVNMSSYRDIKTNHLSVGQRQRIGIARSIIGKPKIILADEPTGNMDPNLASSIMNLFHTLSTFNVNVILATHDWHLIQSMPVETLVIHNKKIIHTHASKILEYVST